MSKDLKEKREELSRQIRERFLDLNNDVEALKEINPSLSLLLTKVLAITAFMQAEKFYFVAFILGVIEELSSTTLNLIIETRQSIPEISEEQIQRLEEIHSTITGFIEETRKEAERGPHFII